VIPPACKRRLAIEAGWPMGWERYVGLTGRVLGIRRFGASGPAKAVGEFFGMTSAHILAAAREMF